MGKKYTTDEIEVGGHMLDASMMTSLDTIVTDSSSYFTTSGGTLTGDLTVDGNAIASGIGIGTSTIYSNSVNLNNSGTLRIGNAEFLAKAGNDLSVYQGKMRVQQGGNVGIGTTSPGALLQVGGGSSYNTLFHTFDQYNEVKFHGVNNQSASGVWQFINDGTWNQTRFYVQDANNIASRLTFRFTGNNGANEILTGTSTGYVGIGTTSPGYKLHVNSGTINNIAKFESSDGGGVITVKDSGGEVSFSNIGNDIYFKTSSSQSNKMVILNSGNVGIGTTNPQAKLEVIGDVNASGFTNKEGGNKNRLLLPKGASYNGGGSEAGAIKITLPVLWTNTMMRITIKVFDYSTGESFDVTVGGYNYVGSGSGGFWVNTSAWISSQSDKDRNFTVRFGSDGSKAIVYIGELNSYWAYLKVNVIDVELNHNDTSNHWSTTSWAIGLESSSFQNVSRTHSNCQVNNWKRSGQDVYYASGTGNVGIGTTGPTNLLTLSQKADSNGLRINGYDDHAGSYGVFNITSGGNLRIANNNSLASGYIQIHAETYLELSAPSLIYTQSHFRIYDSGMLSFGNSGDFKFKYDSTNDKLNITTDDNLGLTMDNVGNVGIGTTSPNAALEVVGDIKLSDNSHLTWATSNTRITGQSGYMQFQVGATDKMRITSIGYVGIGTTNPLKKLHVKETSGTYEAAIFETNAGGSFIRSIDSTGSVETGIQGGKWSARTSNLQRLVIDSSGNVGIGTTNPSQKLTVQGNTLSVGNITAYGDVSNSSTLSNTGYLQLRNSGSTNVNIRSNGSSYFNGGNVGVGTASPGFALDVHGDSTVGVLSVKNAANGRDTFRSENATGTRTVNIGNDGSGHGIILIRNSSGTTTNYISGSGNSYFNSGNVGIGTTSPGAKLDIQPTASNRKVTRIANDVMSTYSYNTQADAILAWTCGSYYQAEVVITANQTNGGTTNNLYIRGIWSNNHTSHHWDELEHIGGLQGSTITMSVGQNGATTNSGRLELDFNYISQSFAALNIRVTDFYGAHSYTIS